MLPSWRTTARDVLVKALPSPLERLCRFVVVLVAAPVLGADRFGAYQFAVTTSLLLLTFVELGVGTWTTRALARDPSSAARVVRSGAMVRAASTIPYAAAIAVAASLLPPHDSRTTLVLVALAALLASFVDQVGAVLRGREDFVTEAVVNVARAIVLTTASLAALLAVRTLTSLAAGSVIGSVAAAAFAVAVLATRVPDALRAAAPIPLREMRLGPLWLAGVFSVLYFRVDVVLLRVLSSEHEVGLYAAAYRLFEATTLLPAAISAVAFPRLSRADAPRTLATHTTLVLALAGTFAGLVLAGASAVWVRLAFGAAFAGAAHPLAALGLAAPFLFANYGLSVVLFARGLERVYVVLAAGLFVVNVAANLVAVPRWGGVGAALVTAACEALLVAGSIGVLASAARRSVLAGRPA